MVYEQRYTQEKLIWGSTMQYTVVYYLLNQTAMQIDAYFGMLY